MDFQKRRVQLLAFIVAVVSLSIAAEKCREMMGEDSSSQSGKFSIFYCFDMSTGTLACTATQAAKLYVYNLRSSHVERARNAAIENAIHDAMQQGIQAKDVAKLAQREGAKAAKLAMRKTRRIVGPIVSSGWDFFEAVYYGGTVTEGFLRGAGSLFGAYGGGFLGEEKAGRVGYLVGSQLGSWVGGRIGLMVYDVVNGVGYLVGGYESSGYERPESEDSEKESSLW
ncbi:hypothetical protein LINGRAHAP2_LOCUS19014 [Linum grandiflorum]